MATVSDLQYDSKSDKWNVIVTNNGNNEILLLDTEDIPLFITYLTNAYWSIGKSHIAPSDPLHHYGIGQDLDLIYVWLKPYIWTEVHEIGEIMRLFEKVWAEFNSPK